MKPRKKLKQFIEATRIVYDDLKELSQNDLIDLLKQVSPKSRAKSTTPHYKSLYQKLTTTQHSKLEVSSIELNPDLEGDTKFSKHIYHLIVAIKLITTLILIIFYKCFLT